MGAVQTGAEMLATLCCSLFAGAAVYINLVEHPARMECGPEVAMTEFPASYRRATPMQVTLAILGFVLSVAAWIGGASLQWLVGGVVLVAVVPFTLIVIMPVNRRLLEPTLNTRSPEAAQLLARWGRLHAVRSILSVLALLVFLVAQF